MGRGFLGMRKEHNETKKTREESRCTEMMEDPLYNFEKKFTNIKDTQPGFLSFDKFL